MSTMEDANLQQSMSDTPYARLLGLCEVDTQLKAALPDPALSEALKADGLTGAEIVTLVFAGYADRPAMGERAYTVGPGPGGKLERRYEAAFSTISYAELRRRTEALATCWRAEAQFAVHPGEFICTLGFTGIGLAIVDLATLVGQTVVVPMQANQPVDQLRDIVAETRPAMIVAALDNIQLAVALGQGAPGCRSIMVVDYDPRCDAERAAYEGAQDQLAGTAVSIASIETLVERGMTTPFEPLPRPSDGTDRLGSLLFTSGSTGTPKGAIIPERITNRFWTAVKRPQPTITLAYAPLNHHFGRNMVYGTLAQGGTVFFTLKSDMSTLFEDFRLVRPTSIAFIPRVIDIVHDRYKSEVARRAAQLPQRAAGSIEADVLAEMRSFLGDRLVAGSVGTAPAGEDAKAFMQACFGISLVEGYGSTECGGVVAIEGKVARDYIIDYKLRDVPELGYRSSDKPYPRGELLVCSRLQIPGYFKRPDADAALFDENGYVATGDIMEERGPDHIVWVDRKNNVLKLAHGEYVAISNVESGLEGASPLVAQLHVYGNARYAFLLAVAVPDPDAIVQALGADASDADVKAAILASLQQSGRDIGLKAFEIPRDILVEREAFTIANGLLSSVMKPLRPKLKEKYGARLEALYVEISERQVQGLAATAAAEGASIEDRIAALVTALLGIEAVDVSKRQSFTELSGDSLSAVSLSLSIEELFGVDVPVGTLLDPTGSVAHWARLVEEAKETSVPTFASVHQAGPGSATFVHARDLLLPTFLGDDFVAASAQPSGPASSVLLTGANGHLGHILCLSWLERLASRGGELVCLVRASDDEAAARRLHAMFEGCDPGLAARFHDLAARHLRVLAGDLTRPNLGLSPECYGALADTVDTVVHPAALVNHMLAYRDLFHPNVVGTAELIRFALTARRKAVHFISSVAVPRLTTGTELPRENEDVREALPSVALTDAYASGYGLSKWAGEILLRDASDRYGLDVVVIRGDMMLTDRRFAGQINVDDMFSRLLASVALSGLAPLSFYQRESDGSRPHAHYDGMAVDYMAEAITEIGDAHRTGYATYNVSNYHHDDGVSLDRVVDWIAGAGYRVERIDDLATWVELFEAAMAALPDTARQRSILPIIKAYEKPQSPRPKAMPSADFRRAIEALETLPAVPNIDADLVRKSLADLVLLGIIPAPVEQGAAAEPVSQAR
jgi:fatty acid CoA ligase FadD9